MSWCLQVVVLRISILKLCAVLTGTRRGTIVCTDRDSDEVGLHHTLILESGRVDSVSRPPALILHPPKRTREASEKLVPAASKYFLVSGVHDEMRTKDMSHARNFAVFHRGLVARNEQVRSFLTPAAHAQASRPVSSSSSYHRTIAIERATIHRVPSYNPATLTMADDQFSETWAAAIKQYEADTKINIANASHDFAGITSAEQLLEIIQDEQKKFKKYRKRGEKIYGALKPVLEIVGSFADAAGEAVGTVLRPGKVIFAAVKLLLDAAKNVSTRYNLVIDIFGQMKGFLERCRIYLDGNISSNLQHKLVEIFSHLLSVIGVVTKDMKRGWLMQFVWSIFRKNDDMQGALTKLDHLTTQEHLAVQGVIYQEVGHMRRKIDKIDMDAELDACYKWLNAPDSSVNQHTAYDKQSRKSTTGKWIFEDQRFKDWMQEPHSSMWLYGKPGGGKTVLCSTIIKMLQDHEFEISSAMAYFYFDFSDPSKQNFYSLLKSLLRQLSSQSLDASAVLKKLYNDHDRGHSQPGWLDLQTALGNILKCFDAVYIVLDALDEWLGDDRGQYLSDFVQDVLLNSQYSVHFLATSRGEVDIDRCLRTRVSCTISLNDTMIHQDIKEYLSIELAKRDYGNYIGQIIMDILLAKANGMFLWVTYQLKELDTCTTLPALQEALADLPRTLEETYDRIFQKINHREAETFSLMLSWIAFAVQPLTKSELDAAVEISYRECHPDFKGPLHLQPSSMLNIISSLIDESKDILLEKGANINAQGDLYGTALIAASYQDHAEFIQMLLEKGADVNAQAGRYGTALIAASYWGCTEIAQILLENGIDVNTQAGHYGTALIAASHEGHTNIAQMLLEKGADVNTQADIFGTALIAALSEGHSKLAQILLKKGADINAQAGHYGTALTAVSYWEYLEMAHILIEKGTDINAQAGYYGTALTAASHEGHTKLVQILLEKGADINAQAGHYGTALEAASYKNHSELAQILLEKGADINAQAGHYGTALITASSLGYLELTQILLEKGADINAQAGHYGTALIAALSEGFTELAQILLEKGADVNAQAGHYGTALIAASYKNHKDLALSLLKKGADVNAECVEYGNALIAASYVGHSEMVQILLERGADINRQSDDCGTALIAASITGCVEVAQILIENGADVNAVVSNNGNALRVACYHGRSEIVQILLENGADPNAQASEYNTALIAASSMGHTEVAQILLERGADINAQAGRFGTALIAASFKGHRELAETLIQRGADVNAQASSLCRFETALKAAYDDEKMIELLQKYGAKHSVYQYSPSGL
ncbi:hypothetical protein EVG20_g9764 [Dentipellis fragilis]|uniref:NACHT domain-containing protein n=1 Tax=Dentipellis fragilis TaxID=205917 RepID=A0A4Y9XW31_9AGAM|nr:hypothetical protein EVG20_g9764 [Dentipellis fragilis]